VISSGVVNVHKKTSGNKIWVSGTSFDVEELDPEITVKSIECRTTDLKLTTQKVICLIMPASN
jgi:hypothetical protein